MKALHCHDPSNNQVKLANLLIHMKTLETFEEEASAPKEEVPKNTPFTSTVHIHGSLILQELLNFNKPIKAVNSLLSMEATVLRGLLSDPKGSHVTDAFMASPTVGEKSREGLVKALHGELVALACSKHGSRSLDAIWKRSSPKMKEIIAGELSKKETIMNNNTFGKFISTNCALSLFKRAREEWNKLQKSDNKKRELFDDILGTKKKDLKREAEPEAPVDAQEDEKKNSSSPPKKKKKQAKSYLDDL